MSAKQSDIFDDHFRNAAEQHEPGFSEAAWKKMEVKLDNEGPSRKPVGWFWWFSDGLIITTMIFIAISLIDQKQHLNTIAASHLTSDRHSSVVTETTTAAPGIAKQQKGRAGEDKKAPVIDIGTKQQPVISSARNRLEDNPANSSKPLAKVVGDSVDAKDKNAGDVEATATNTVPVVNNVLQSQGGEKNNRQVAPVKATEDVYSGAENKTPMEKNDVPATAFSTEEKLTANNKADKKRSAKSSQNSNHFFLHAGGGPEWSFVPGNPVGTVTPVYGGGIGYIFNKHWSVQAGIYATKKDYKADGDDYNPKEGSYFYNVKIYSVKALCNIIEIPVAVNYTFLQKKRSSLYAGAGFSSLIMNEETYHYDYERMNGSAGYWKGTYKTGNFYPFAVAMLSAGYKLNVTKSLSITAAPYLKLPVYGIGEGSVKLGATGILAGLQYELPACKKQK